MESASRSFGDSAQELKTEGWVTLGFGLLVLSAPGFQIYCTPSAEPLSPAAFS